MNRKLLLSFIAGAVCGAAVMLFVSRSEQEAPPSAEPSASQEPAAAETRQEEIPVLVVSAETIPAYQVFSEDMVTVRMMRISDVPPGALRTFEDLKGGEMTYEDQEGNLRKYKGHWGNMVLKSKAYRGDVITEPKLKWESGFADYTDIPDGFRVMSVSLEDSPVDFDSLRPYHLVDIFSKPETQDAREVEEPQPILERIRIYEVGKPTTEYERKHVTLLVDPHQAAILLRAEQKGPIIVALHQERKASDR